VDLLGGFGEQLGERFEELEVTGVSDMDSLELVIVVACTEV
jgi:hypothetical protein